MNFLILFFLFFAWHANAADIASISVSKFDDKYIKLVYQPPQNRKRLTLADPYEGRSQLIRQEWKPLDDCGHIDNGIVIIEQQCKTASFLIPVEAMAMDRVYPTAYPFAEQGVLMHTGAMAISDECCNIIWNFDAGKGAIIVDGVNLGSKKSFHQASKRYMAFTGVFLSSKPLDKNAKVIATSASPAWLVNGVNQATSEITRYYQKTYPKLNFKPPILFISNIQDDNQSVVQADVSSPRMIRFGFVNAQQTPDDNYLIRAKRLAAHEFAHLLQPNKKSTPAIHEGGAEFIRWMAEYKLGWENKNALGKQFIESLFSCLNNAGTANWSDLELNSLTLGNDIYNCGLIVHVIALASRKNFDSAEHNIYYYNRHWQESDDANFAQDIECGELKNCKSVLLAETLTSKTLFVDQIDHQLNNLGIVKSESYVPGTKSLVKKNYYEIDMDKLLVLLDKRSD